MEALAVAVISAGAVVASAIISGVVSNRRINQTIAVHDEKLFSHETQSGSRHNILSEEHRRLEQSGQRLSQHIGEKISGVAGTVEYLKDEQIRDAMRISALKDDTQALHQSAQQIGDFAKAFERITAENNALKMENKELRQEIQQMKSRGVDQRRPGRDRDHDLEL